MAKMNTLSCRMSWLCGGGERVVGAYESKSYAIKLVLQATKQAVRFIVQYHGEWWLSGWWWHSGWWGLGGGLVVVGGWWCG